MPDEIRNLLDLVPWFGLVVAATAYAQLRWRHRLAKATLHRVRGERDEARDQLWRAAKRAIR